MKKIITIFAIIALAVSAAYAGSNPLRMKSGSLRELKSASGTITCSMDFSRTKGNRKPLEQYITEDYGSSMDVFERYQPEMLEWFIERWNDDIEEGPKGVEVPGSNYELRIVVKNLNLGAKTGWGGASISGYADFYRKGEGCCSVRKSRICRSGGDTEDERHRYGRSRTGLPRSQTSVQRPGRIPLRPCVPLSPLKDSSTSLPLLPFHYNIAI